MIPVGAELAVIETGTEETLQTTASAINEPVAENGTLPRSVINQQPAAGNRKPLTSPAIRRLARENDIDLNRVQGTGSNGRITRADIDSYLNLAGNYSTVDKPTPESGGTREIKLLGLRRKIAERMTSSASRIPHFTYVEEVDVTELEQLRRHVNGTRGENQAELTYLPFLMQALVKVVKEFPQCNAHF